MRSMKLLKALYVLLLISIGWLGYLQPSNASDGTAVKVVNGTKVYKQIIPTDLRWGQKSLSSATKAMSFQSAEINSALDKLAARGAVTIVKKYVKTSSAAYPDWNSYVPTFNQYVLSGLDAKGKVVASSAKLPTDSANLASRLIHLEQSRCAPKNLKLTGIKSCSISEPDPKQFLRAALRTALGNGQTEDLGDYIYQQLSTCLAGKKPFTIVDGYFDCPSNAEIFGGDSGFKLNGTFATRSYSIAINTSRYTATLTYGPVNYTTLALTGAYEDGSVVRFG